MNKVRIRAAKRKDSASILKLVLELAKFENLNPPDSSARKRLLKKAFSKNPPFTILLAEIDNSVAGYAIFFYTFSSFLARRTLYLEDIFISEEFRKMNIGKLLFNKIVKEAQKNKCGRIEWVVLDWNENAIKFYEKLGAKELKDWKVFRFPLIYSSL